MKNYHPYQGSAQPAAQVKVSHPYSTSYKPLLGERKERKGKKLWTLPTRKREQETNEFDTWAIL